MPMSWTSETDTKLFMAVLKVHKISLNYAALAAIMGPECTGKAISHRIAKLKAITSGSCPSTPHTPKTPKSVKREHGEIDANGEDNTGSADTPSNRKRVKKTPVSQKHAAAAILPSSNEVHINGPFPGLRSETAHVMPSPCASQSDYDGSTTMSTSRSQSQSHFPMGSSMATTITPSALSQFHEAGDYDEDISLHQTYSNSFNLYEHANSFLTTCTSFYEPNDMQHIAPSP